MFCAFAGAVVKGSVQVEVQISVVFKKPLFRGFLLRLFVEVWKALSCAGKFHFSVAI